MIRISQEDLRKLECLDAGKGGSVYKKDDDTAYKIYHQTVKEDLTGLTVTNPALTISRRHFYSLIRRSKHLIYSGGVKDIIYIDGKFGGVCIPYYEGKKFNEIMNSPFDIKVDLSRQMVRNAKELSHHLIFPTDYKLNNVILSNHRAQFIDLDDSKTHVYYMPSLICRAFSVNALGETIQEFLYQYSHYNVPVNLKLKRKAAFTAVSYRSIDEYLDFKEVVRKMILVDKNTDLSKVRELIDNYSFDAIYVGNENDTNEQIGNVAKSIIERQVPLFDVTTSDLVNTYYSMENISEAYTLNKEKRLVKVFDRNS